MKHLNLNLTFHFDIINDLDATAFTYEGLADYILDCVWEEAYNCGLKPGNYEIKITEGE